MQGNLHIRPEAFEASGASQDAAALVAPTHVGGTAEAADLACEVPCEAAVEGVSIGLVLVAAVVRCGWGRWCLG